MKIVRNRLFLITYHFQNYIGLKAVAEKAEMQEKMSSAKTLEVETLRKKLSSHEVEILQHKTKHSPAINPLVELG